MHDHVLLHAYMDACMPVRMYAACMYVHICKYAGMHCLLVRWLVLRQNCELIRPTPSASTCVSGEDAPCVFYF